MSKYYTVLYLNKLKSKNGDYSEIIGHDSVEDATEESTYSVENAVDIKAPNKQELENYFNFVVSNN